MFHTLSYELVGGTLSGRPPLPKSYINLLDAINAYIWNRYNQTFIFGQD